MKRVLLRPPGTSGIHVPTVRAAAVAIADWAVGYDHDRHVGDPVHELVTEGRRAQYERALAAGAGWAVKMPAGYSSCADLGWFVLAFLGMRKGINRADMGGWKVGQNISLLTKLPAYVSAKEQGMPDEGDILHVQSPDHVSVLLRYAGPDQLVDANYGQPHACRRVRPLRDVATGLTVGGRHLVGWVSLGLVATSGALTESAIVPDSFELGTADDNPYSESLPFNWETL